MPKPDWQPEGMLFFDIATQRVFRNQTERFESFVPTVDLAEGWIVFVEYTTYDSGGSSNEIHYEIVDLYPDADAARAQAQRISDRRYTMHRDSKTKVEPVKADGSKVYEHWHNWGQSYEKCVMLKVQVEDEKPHTREEFP